MRKKKVHLLVLCDCLKLDSIAEISLTVQLEAIQFRHSQNVHATSYLLKLYLKSLKLYKEQSSLEKYGNANANFPEVYRKYKMAPQMLICHKNDPKIRNPHEIWRGLTMLQTKSIFRPKLQIFHNI